MAVKQYKAISIMGVVSFPKMPIACEVRRQASKEAVLEASRNKEEIILVTQITNTIGDDFLACVNHIGTVCTIQKVTTTNSSVKLVADGVKRVRIVGVNKDYQFLTVEAEDVEPIVYNSPDEHLLF